MANKKTDKTRVYFEHTQTYMRMLLTLKEAEGEKEVVVVEFKGGIDKGEKGLTGGRYGTDDPIIADALRNHKDHGLRFAEVDSIIKNADGTLKGDGASSEPVKYKYLEPEASNIQSAAKWLADNENIEVAYGDIASITKMKGWLKSNPGVVLFEKLPILYQE